MTILVTYQQLLASQASLVKLVGGDVNEPGSLPRHYTPEFSAALTLDMADLLEQVTGRFAYFEKVRQAWQTKLDLADSRLKECTDEAQRPDLELAVQRVFNQREAKLNELLGVTVKIHHLDKLSRAALRREESLHLTPGDVLQLSWLIEAPEDVIEASDEKEMFMPPDDVTVAADELSEA